MSLGRLLRRASSKASDLLTFNPGAGGTSARSGLDGEIIFSKNNVCVHPAEPVPGVVEHHPGLASTLALYFNCLCFVVSLLTSPAGLPTSALYAYKGSEIISLWL